MHVSSIICEILRRAYGKVRVIDTTFPMLDYLWSSPDQVCAVFADALDEQRCHFYGRFKQCGGHEPLFSTGGRPSIGASDAAAVVALDVASEANFRTFLQAPNRDTAFLIDDDGQAGLWMMDFKALGFAPPLRLQFESARGMGNRYLLLPAEHQQARREVIVAAGGDPHRQASVSMKYGMDSLPQVASLMARRFVHDGSQASEGDEGYSWLWIGEEKHIRIMLGAVDPSYRFVRAIVPNALSTANLQGARFTINGEWVATRCEVWSEGVGALNADLPAQMSGELMLGVAFPSSAKSKDGSKVLTASLDRIELKR